jgi:hypothetical protein
MSRVNGRVASRKSGWKVWGLVGALCLGGVDVTAAPAPAGSGPAAVPPAARPAPTLALGPSTSPRVLTLEQLRALPSVTYRVEQPQLRRSFSYRGVTLRDLAELGGFGGQDLRLYASNGYLALIRARDYLNAPIMVAYEADGHAISVRDKGPLTVVLPPEPARYRTLAYSGAWVWYVNRLTPVQAGAQGGK